MTKRIFAAVIAIAMVCTMFAFTSSAAENTFSFDKSAAYGWANYLNALNVIDSDNADLADLRADGTPYKIFLNELLIIMNGALGSGATGDQMNAYIMTQDGVSGTRLYDYVQDTFGAYAYILRGGKQKAVDYWNSKLSVPLSMDDNGYTYTTAATQKAYDVDAYQACLNALQSYMTTANDNYCFNVENGGKRYLDQKAKYETLVAAIDACAVTTPAVLPETTVTIASGSNYTWYGYLNVVNVIPDTETEGLRANGTPYKVFLTEMLSIMNGHGAESDAAYMNSYAMSDGTLLKDYVQDTFGAYAYVLRGGRQKAADYWNSKLSVALVLNSNSYTYTNAAAQETYDATAYQAALDALDNYMANTGDASCFDVENGGGRFFDQRTKYEAFVAAVDACAATAEKGLVDFTDVTTSDATLNILINFYNNVDVESIKADADVQNWAQAIKDGIAAGKGATEIFVGSTDVVSLWENVIRYTVLLNAGARTAADAVFNDASNWPLGTVIFDLSQTTYKASQYNDAYNLWVKIREEYSGSTTVKTSEVQAACAELKAKLQSLEVASLPFTSAQKEAVGVLNTYVPYYRARVNRIVLDSNKATDTYKNYVALVEQAEAYMALDWENGTSASYPTVDEMHALILPGAEGGALEVNWYPFRQAFGLDNNGYDTLIANTYAAWVESGLYTDESLAEVKTNIDNLTIPALTGARSSQNTDEMVQGDIDILKAMLVEKPAGPSAKLAIRGATLNLSESIAIYFAVDPSSSAEYTDLYVEFKKGDEVTVSRESVTMGGMTCFKFSNLSAYNAIDDITVTLHGTFNGQEYTADAYSYSVKTYCYNMLSRSTTQDAVKKVCVDLLNYAAASQIYFNYKADTLVNADLTEEQKAYGSSSYDTLTDGKTNSGEYTDYGIKGFTLLYEEVIKIMVAVDAKDLTGLVAKVTMDGVVYEFDASEFTNRGSFYSFNFTNILPSQFRKTFSVTLEKDGVAVGNTMTYSVESYFYSKMNATGTPESLKNIMEATIKYGDSCAAFFGK